MQRAPCVFRVASSLCPMRVRSRTAIKRLNVNEVKAVQAEKAATRYDTQTAKAAPFIAFPVSRDNQSYQA